MKKKTHGGARKGAGRHKKEKTVVVRIPQAIEEHVLEIKENYLTVKSGDN